MAGLTLQPICPTAGHHRRRSAPTLCRSSADEARLYLSRCHQRGRLSGFGSVKLYDGASDQRHRRSGDEIDMARRGNATFVGFGFGPIQAGLFCYEARQSGAFRHLVVAEIAPEVVASVRAAGGHYQLNVAHLDRVETVTVGPVQLEDPAV